MTACDGTAGAGSGPEARNIVREVSLVPRAERERRLGQRGVTLWLTGLSAAGKSTVAKELERTLIQMGYTCLLLDGDNIRHGLNKDLGFSAEDRQENIRRIAEVARLFNDAGIIVITAFISPYRKDRESARAIIGPACYLEVHISTPLRVCEARDPKQLYQKARAGTIPHFTGISDPYEEPEEPAAILDTSKLSVDACVAQLIELLKEKACFL